nr:immunoglobulin light chain junction region [Macaca mulatta]MOW27760.1 immunoglobulin light chain junction region [Macaca mulatta]MOW27795.1 immunoglobulin light chain junction region [Macaca mulatta]MOW27988.1 immunoglobulin light chain junction region [Macaca mulatta]MOW28792.1 immunoglobulin light chain junction region [Macaca mulatta]
DYCCSLYMGGGIYVF